MIGTMTIEQHKHRRRIGMSLVCTILSNVLIWSPGIANSACAPGGSAQDQVISAIKTMFAAARGDDLAKFNSVAEPKFYAYDGGRLFLGPALMGFIQQAHAAGKVFEWKVTEPQVHVSCNAAWITYINRGAVQDSSGRQDVTWLESAFLDYQNGHWLVHFLHSTRAPASQ
jgi:hypothetical protein